jgi:hypothetical protein
VAAFVAPVTSAAAAELAGATGEESIPVADATTLAVSSSGNSLPEDANNNAPLTSMTFISEISQRWIASRTLAPLRFIPARMLNLRLI